MSGKSEQRPATCTNNYGAAATMENRPEFSVRVRRAVQPSCFTVWRSDLEVLDVSICRYAFGLDTLSTLLACYRYAFVCPFPFIQQSSPSRLETTFESSLSSSFPLVQLPLVSREFVMHAKRPSFAPPTVVQSFSRSSEEPLQVTKVCYFA